MEPTHSKQTHWDAQDDDPDVRIDGRVDALREDAYWRAVYWTEPYFRPGLDYEDYAPAYCVGYIGFAQYGGRIADAERCLCANWIRIKGDARLELPEALAAIRAAWRHAEAALERSRSPAPVALEAADPAAAPVVHDPREVLAPA